LNGVNTAEQAVEEEQVDTVRMKEPRRARVVGAVADIGCKLTLPRRV
jgi:hypothetical protein